MTKSDLLDWAISKGCETFPLPNVQTHALGLKNHSNNKEAFFNTHRMDGIADPSFICLICTRLGIEVPNYGKAASDIISKLDDI